MTATKAANVRQRDLCGRQGRPNFKEIFSVPVTGHLVRARPTNGSGRGFGRSILIR